VIERLTYKTLEIREMTKMHVITSYIKGQRLKWFRHVKRRGSTNKPREIIECQPEGKIPRGRPINRWIEGIKQNLERLEISNWEELVQDCGSLKALTVSVKTHTVIKPMMMCHKVKYRYFMLCLVLYLCRRQ